MVTAIIFAIIYATGVSATMFHQMDENMEQDVENFMSGREETPSWACFLLSIWAVVAGILWPAYWTVRALYAVPERLALNPGEPQ
jgi:phosphotransferase system  glucose/maltose/N-acetylglucosamine-specific IIC component